MSGSGNGKLKNPDKNVGGLKNPGKSVGVYIGSKDSAVAELLELVCQKFDLSESELLRKIFCEKLVEWNLLNPEDHHQVVEETVEKIKAEIDVTRGRLPRSL